jgi:phosphoglucosamine mutase
MLTEEVLDSKTSLSALKSPVKLYPQRLKNVKVKDKKAVLNDENVQKVKKSVEDKLNKKGRVLLRESGTEPVIRIMVEAETDNLATLYTEEIYNAIISGGYSIE